MTIPEVIHILRTPCRYSAEAQREARLQAADLLKQLLPEPRQTPGSAALVAADSEGGSVIDD